MTTAREAFLAYCTRYCYEPDDRFYAFWQAGRDSMREEAAKVCESEWEIDGTFTAKQFANVVRAIK